MFEFVTLALSLVIGLTIGAIIAERAIRGDVDRDDLEAALEPFRGVDRAQTGGSNLAGLVIGLTIAAIIAVAVAIPVINQVVADANVAGTTGTILDLLDLFVGLLILVAIAAPLMRRT